MARRSEHADTPLEPFWPELHLMLSWQTPAEPAPAIDCGASDAAAKNSASSFNRPTNLNARQGDG
jgi:hypothetical protein